MVATGENTGTWCSARYVVTAPKTLAATLSKDLSKSTLNEWSQSSRKEVSRSRCRGVNTVRCKHQRESVLGILSLFYQLVSTALESARTYYTIWASCSTILPNNPRGCRPSFRREGEANEPRGTRPASSPCRDPINTSLGEMILQSGSNSLAITSTLWSPRGVSGDRRDAEGGKKRKQEDETLPIRRPPSRGRERPPLRQDLLRGTQWY